MSKEKYKHNIDNHLSNDLLFRYSEGDTTIDENERIQKHLNACAFCFHLMSSFMRQSLSPIREAELLEIERSLKLSPEAQLQKLFPPSGTTHADLVQKIQKILQGIFPSRHRWQLATGLATIALLFVFFGLPRYNAWQSMRWSEKGISQFTEFYSISSREAPRASGGFEYYEFGITRGPEQMQKKPFTESFEKAIRLNKNNFKAHEYLGTYYLYLEGNLQKAEKEYLQALNLKPNHPSIQNDLGVLEWHKGNLTKAIQHFQAALKGNPFYKEAQYNLAISYEKSGNPDKARDAWKNYLRLDSHSDWAAIARVHLKNLSPQ